jgi:hypothetical protein
LLLPPLLLLCSTSGAAAAAAAQRAVRLRPGRCGAAVDRVVALGAAENYVAAGCRMTSFTSRRSTTAPRRFRRHWPPTRFAAA